MTGLTTSALQMMITVLSARNNEIKEILNDADSALGDGDLGITMSRGISALAACSAELPPDLGQAFQRMAQDFVAVSASSFGTLVATAFLAAAKSCRDRQELPWASMADLLDGARENMQKRGKGNLGDKSILDSLDSAVRALQVEKPDTPDRVLAVICHASQKAMDEYLGKPCKLGRAKMYAQASIGKTDPGMLAFDLLSGILAGQK